jgi:hypothetical protein
MQDASSPKKFLKVMIGEWQIALLSARERPLYQLKDI